MEIQSEVCIVVSQRVYLSTIQISSPDRRMGDAGMQPAFLEMTTHLARSSLVLFDMAFDRGVGRYLFFAPGVGGGGRYLVFSFCPSDPIIRSTVARLGVSRFENPGPIPCSNSKSSALEKCIRRDDLYVLLEIDVYIEHRIISGCVLRTGSKYQPYLVEPRRLTMTIFDK